MENPYASPAIEASVTSMRVWLQTAFAILAGIVSVLVLAGMVSKCLIFARQPTWPTAISRWAGIFGMTVVMLITSVAFAQISVGLFRSRKRSWKRGLWILFGSLLDYAALVGVTAAMQFLT